MTGSHSFISFTDNLVSDSHFVFPPKCGTYCTIWILIFYCSSNFHHGRYDDYFLPSAIHTELSEFWYLTALQIFIKVDMIFGIPIWWLRPTTNIETKSNSISNSISYSISNSWFKSISNSISTLMVGLSHGPYPPPKLKPISNLETCPISGCLIFV